MTIGVRKNKSINPQVLERKKVGNPWSRGVSLSFPGEDYLLSIRGTVSPLMAFLTLKVIVSGTRNVLNVITCNLSSNDELLLWGVSYTIKKSNHTMPGATEPALGLQNVITFYLLLCPGIGNTWTSRLQRESLDSYPQDSPITF
ncbi:hypothetical protein AVEN_155403-1 [Araneus ventricosus]|uniref:Uncharacterized protein n=1 Tax=Araneus ventricosus TaxID=182803 RepID=A0A4Y2W0B1_ARAVE|nr:hypothetical protein AVEN_155403-1 [Araneus ventricosus]